jgi:hypothetical protein
VAITLSRIDGGGALAVRVGAGVSFVVAAPVAVASLVAATVLVVVTTVAPPQPASVKVAKPKSASCFKRRPSQLERNGRARPITGGASADASKVRLCGCDMERRIRLIDER